MTMLVELETALYDDRGRRRPRGTVLDTSELPHEYVLWVTRERAGGPAGVWRPYEIGAIDDPAKANRRLTEETKTDEN